MSMKHYQFNSYELKMGEMPSGNGNGCARGMAKFANLIAMKGEMYGMRFLNEKTIDLAHSEPKKAFDMLLEKETDFNLGGWHHYKDDYIEGTTVKGFIGWAGIGGSIL
eukprot:TRINITY_DN48826_c0_g2_i1.p1 TRINITY_DN48826_c0_g2~~TRINITY_DN48826_c0_g2_i1.p1  ORF type:complete len:108 (-),score=5.09 TRINITY_DN48826_c0_g2_i1:222-545(-)